MEKPRRIDVLVYFTTWACFVVGVVVMGVLIVRGWG